MKIITLHCDYITFKPLKKALKAAEDLKDTKEVTVKEPLVVLTSVEKGDNDKTVDQLIAAIRKTAADVNAKNIVLYPYAHLSSKLADPTTALEYLTLAEHTLEKDFKVTRAPFGYYKSFELKVKGHPLSELSKEFVSGNIEDVRGEHKVIQIKEDKDTGGKIILDRRNLKSNDHRILGEDLKLFHFAEEVGAGLPLWLPNGEVLRHSLMEYMRKIEEKYGYSYVATPNITKGKLYEKTGHLPYYADSMYSPIEIDGVKYYLRPMNCPHHHMIYNKLVQSYRDLPLRLAEAGTVYRNELSGVTYGLMRVRCFTQNDAHIYVTPEQLKEEFMKVIEMFEEVYKAMGIKDYWFRLSLPDFKAHPDKFTGDPKVWENASNEIKKAMKESKKKFVEGVGEAAFYGPKIDVQIKNSQGKEETIATSQVDITIPQRLNMVYTDEHGKKHHPLIIHRAILGSYERFIAYLLEQTEGRLPVWLSPIQVRVINFTDRNTKAAKALVAELKEEIPGIRVDTDFRSDTVQAKVRDAELQKIPYIIVLGDKEEESKTLAVRKHGKASFGIKKDSFFKELAKEVQSP